MPTISNISAVTTGIIKKYQMFEASFDLETVASNNFFYFETNTPSGITSGIGVTVDGLFSCDSWATTSTVPAFEYQDYISAYGSLTGSYGSQKSFPLGSKHWRIRFAPETSGTWEYQIRATDTDGTVTTSGGTFTCSGVLGRGFVCKSVNIPGYPVEHELSDGTTLFSIGTMVRFYNTVRTSALLDFYGKNNVKCLRWWMNHRETPCPFSGGHLSTMPHWGFAGGITTAVSGAKSGDWWSAPITNGVSRSQGIYLSGGITYRLSGYVKCSGVTKGTGTGAYLKLSLSSPTSSIKTSAITGTTDWVLITKDFYATTTSSNYSVSMVHDGSAGTAYFDEVSLKPSGATSWGGEIVLKGDFDFHKYIDLHEAWHCDQIFSIAQANGIYLRCNLLDVPTDILLGTISNSGTYVANNETNFNASSSPISAYPATGYQLHPSRFYQLCYYRYLIGRWGAYQSLHSIERNNEESPTSNEVYYAADYMAHYIHDNYPRRILCGTSTYWGAMAGIARLGNVDFIDIHEYLGPQGNKGYIIDTAWQATPMTSNNYSWLPTGYYSIDTTNAPSGGGNSLKISHKSGNQYSFYSLPIYYYVNVDDSRTYTLEYWAKVDNMTAPDSNDYWQRPGLMATYSIRFGESDWYGNGDTTGRCTGWNPYYTPSGFTRDWTKFSSTVSIPSGANVVNLWARMMTSAVSGSSTMWLGGIKLIDNTTGDNLFLPSNLDDKSLIEDTANATRKYGLFLYPLNSKHGVVSTWTETLITGRNCTGGTSEYPYKGYSTGFENYRLVDDLDGIHLKKLIWAHLAYNPNMFYWSPASFDRYNSWKYHNAFSKFVSGVNFTNYKVEYLDSEDSSALRAWGRVDRTSGNAYLWVDNKNYNWKAVADTVCTPTVWSSAHTYSTYFEVYYQGTLYKSRSSHSNICPTGTGTYWSSSDVYTSGDIVVKDGFVYQCITRDYVSGTPYAIDTAVRYPSGAASNVYRQCYIAKSTYASSIVPSSNTWSSSAEYSSGDAAYHYYTYPPGSNKNETWYCHASIPTAWASDVTYVTGNQVRYPTVGNTTSGSKVYTSLIDENLNKIPSTVTSAWSLTVSRTDPDNCSTYWTRAWMEQTGHNIPGASCTDYLNWSTKWVSGDVYSSGAIAPVSGTIALTGMPSCAYTVEWWDTSSYTYWTSSTVFGSGHVCGYGDPLHTYTSLTSANSAHEPPNITYWSDNGVYNSILYTTSVTASGTTLSIPVSSLQSDIAIKVYVSNSSGSVGYIQFSSATSSILESSGSISLEVQRVSGSTGIASAMVYTLDETALADTHYTGITSALSWANGNSDTKSISIPITNNETYDGNVTFTANISGVTGSLLGNIPTNTVTILDDEIPASGLIQFQSASYQVSEIAGLVFADTTLKVDRVSGSTGAASAVCYTVDGTAFAGLNYNATSTNLIWTSGSSATKNFNVTVRYNPEYTDDVYCTVHLSGLSGVGLGNPASATLTFLDHQEEPARGELNFTWASSSVSEATSSISLWVSRTSGTYENASVSYIPISQTASAGVDFTLNEGTLTWTNGTSSEQEIVVLINDNLVYEGDKTFGVYLTGVVGASLGDTNYAQITILENEPPVVYYGNLVMILRTG